MTQPSPDRKAHVTRIIGTNTNGDKLTDIWADLLRIDQFKVREWGGQKLGSQDRLITISWQDDINANETGNPTRTTKVLKLCSPDEPDPQNPTEWIPIPLTEKWSSRATDLSGTGMGDDTLKYNQFQLPDNTTTEIDPADLQYTLVRVTHWDTNLDDDSTYENGGVIAWEDYKRVQGTEDTSDYVDAVIPTQIAVRVTHESGTGMGDDQRKTRRFNNQYLIEMLEAPPGDVSVPPFNPPWILDPLQYIVNVQLGAPQQVIAGVAGINHFNNPFNEGTIASNDGIVWNDPGFGAGSGAAVSGLGFTVVGMNNTLVAFGKPSSGDACFIAVQGATGAVEAADIKRGILVGGQIVWTVVASLPLLDASAGAYSCSFAGGAFFISYKTSETQGDATEKTWLAVSFDGFTFTSVDAFPGVADVANPDGATTGGPDPNPYGGNVVYDKQSKLYVTTGSYTLWYYFQVFNGDTTINVVADNQNFMSSVSTDGLNWTPYFDTSRGIGKAAIDPTKAIEMIGTYPSCICFGKGIYVAASSYKNQEETDFGTTDTYLTTIEACSVATSKDGVTWTNTRLPHTISEGRDGGNTNAVCFVEASGSSTGGFFMAAGLEFTSLGQEGYEHTLKIWTSDDAITWTLTYTASTETCWVLSLVNKKLGNIAFVGAGPS